MDGPLRITVTGVRCGVASLGAPGSTVYPRGQFCEVALTLVDVASSAAVFDANVQYAYVGAVRYRISPPAQLALPEMGGDTYPIEPGGVLDAVVAFDIPATSHITSLELHGARSSPGVLVLLGGEPPFPTGPTGSA